MSEKKHMPFPLLGTAAGLMAISESFGLLLDSTIQATAGIRSFQIILLLALLAARPGGLALAGLSIRKWGAGLKAGLTWSFGFGILVLVLGFILYLAGIHPLRLIHASLPKDHLILFFITGGLVGPVCEELFFRGFLYTFFKRFGVPAALVITTLIFALLHLPHRCGVLIQIIGGLVFSISFERSKSLVTPICIHVLGNLAIFSLSLFSDFLLAAG